MKFHMLKLFLMEKVIPDEDFWGFSLTIYFRYLRKKMQSSLDFEQGMVA
jgi:hypothetical protein